jgi:HEAT repeat protein
MSAGEHRSLVWIVVPVLLVAAALTAVWAWRRTSHERYTPPPRDAAFWRHRAAVPHNRVRADALKNLAKTGDPKSAPLVLQAMETDPSGYVRAVAAEAVGSFEDRRHVAPLRGALKDSDPRVSDAAVLSLRRLGGEKALDALVKAVDPEDERKTVMIVTALPAFKARRAEDALVRLLDAPSAWIRWRTIAALRQVGTRRCVPKLEALQDDPFKGTEYEAPPFKKHDVRGLVGRLLQDAISAASKRPPWPETGPGGES